MRHLCSLVLLFAFIWPTLSYGASAREGSGEADARLQALVQQLTVERAALQAENGRLEGEKEDLEESVEKLEKALAAERKELKKTEGQFGAEKMRSDAFEQQNGQLRDRLQELADRYRELAEVLSQVESQRDELIALAQDYDARVVLCERNNDNLYTVVDELISAYKNKGVFRTLLEKEPFTQLKRVQVENMMDEYRYLAEDMRLKFEGGGESGAADALKAEPEASGSE